MASVGQAVLVQITSARFSLALISKVVDATTEKSNLVALTDGVDPWPTIDTPNGLVAGGMVNVTKGSGVGQWQELSIPAATAAAVASAVASAIASAGLVSSEALSAAVAPLSTFAALSAATASLGASIEEVADTAGATATEVAALSSGMSAYATHGYVDDAIAEIPGPDVSGLLVVPAAAYAVTGLAMNTYRNPSSERGDGRPTWVTAVCTWSFSLAGSATATLELIGGPGSAPTTVRLTLPFAVGLGLLSVSQTIPVPIAFPVPAGHSYKFHAGTGSSGTFAIASISETAQ